MNPSYMRQKPPARPSERTTTPSKAPTNIMLAVLGWTLLGAAVLMHLSIVEWDVNSWTKPSHIMLFFRAHNQFKLDEQGRTYNIAGASFWGLVVPFLFAGTGVALIRWARSQRTVEPSPRAAPQDSPKPSTSASPTNPLQAASSPPAAPSRLRPCPDCKRSVSRRAPACPGCGCTLEPDDVCPDCQEFVAKDAAQCPNCGCPLRQESKVAVESPPAELSSSDTSAPTGFVIDDDDKDGSIVDLPAVDEGPPAGRPESGGGYR